MTKTPPTPNLLRAAAGIPKGAKTTNWAARSLTPQQIAYAATDAWACRELYVRFRQLNMV